MFVSLLTCCCLYSHLSLANDNLKLVYIATCQQHWFCFRKIFGLKT
ncbi:unnamed protein product [Brassica oleracea]